MSHGRSSVLPPAILSSSFNVSTKVVLTALPGPAMESIDEIWSKPLDPHATFSPSCVVPAATSLLSSLKSAGSTSFDAVAASFPAGKS